METLKIKREKRIVFTLGALVGVIIFGIIYGFAVVNPTNDSLIINGYIEKDLAQHYAGWMLFRSSEWTFPLGMGKNIAYPYGSAVSFTDSIPLFAIFFKILRGILPQTFQYFGLFVLMCFALQGAFGGLLGYRFRNDVISSVLVSVIFTLSPVMLERAFRHCALTAHFFILASLYFYFENKDKEGCKAYIPFIVINALSVTIHPYYMPFTFGIMFAFCIERFFTKKNRISSVVSFLFSMILTVFIGWVIGIFSLKDSAGAYGYGLFSANLNAFFNPVSKKISNWSHFLTERPLLYGSQTEGFNYLGMGILIFIPIAVICCLVKYKKDSFRRLRDFTKKYYGLIFSAAALFVFSCGGTFSFGEREIFTIPWPQILVDKVFAIFRANGRFLWIIDYLIVAFIVYELLTFANRKAQAGVIGLILLIAIQCVDLSDVVATKQAYFRNTDGDKGNQVVSDTLTNPVWDSFAEKCDVLYLIANGYPGIGIDAATVFGSYGKAVNTQFPARQDEADYYAMRDDVLGRIADGEFSDKEIMITERISQSMSDSITENGYRLYYCNHTYIVCGDIFTDDEIQAFTEYGDFKICNPADEITQ